MSKSKKQSVLFEELFSKPIQAKFSSERMTSDGGSVLLVAIDKKNELTEAIGEKISDPRVPEKVLHENKEILRQRVYGIAAGYEDGNDAAKLRSDPILKIACGRGPIQGEDLGSQSTISRFENRVTRGDIIEISKTIAKKVLSMQKRYRKGKRKPKRITIDMDPYCDRTHGRQQLTFFNGCYREYCYLPQVVGLSFDNESKQYAVATVLRPGNRGSTFLVIAILRRLLPLIRESFPKTSLCFRADSDFRGNDLYEYLEKEKIQYVIGLAPNAALRPFSEGAIASAKEQYEKKGIKATVYDECTYQAGSWPQERRVVYKVEHPVSRPRVSDRYLVTNMKYTPKNSFKRYEQRGDFENRIKEFKLDLKADRTSCPRFWANQFRVLLTLTAFVLFQALQDRISGRYFKTAQVSTIREKLFKIAGRVCESTRRIVIDFTDNYPWKKEWIEIACAIGAT